MAKNLSQFMPAVVAPEQVPTGFEAFLIPDKTNGDFDAGSRDQNYSGHCFVWRINRNMCDIRVKITGGGQGGAAYCCCQQGQTGAPGVMQLYSVCNSVNSSGSVPPGSTPTGPLGEDVEVNGVKGQQRLMLRIGMGGCCCTTCIGHESCFSMLCHYCTGTGITETQAAGFICICAGSFQCGGITNCNWGYNNDCNKAAVTNQGSAGSTSLCSGANCGTCCARIDGKCGCTKSTICAGYDCMECTGCAHPGYNMYKGQCCASGRCGVLQMSAGQNTASPFEYGSHYLGIGHGCQEEHNAASMWCQLWKRIGIAGNNYINIRQAGRSNAVPSGCAGGCDAGSQDQAGWGYIRWKDPGYDGKKL
jgi:hypothetical protein